jgi:hypothetical protein
LLRRANAITQGFYTIHIACSRKLAIIPWIRDKHSPAQKGECYVVNWAKNRPIYHITKHPHFEFELSRTRVIIGFPGDDRLRRERLVPDCESRGADLEKSAQKTSANRTNYAALPLAA